MKIAGSQRPSRPGRAGLGRAARPARCWSRTIPGCERLEATGENAYAMTVTAGVAAIRGTYAGTCALSDLEPHESLVMRLQGAGAPGTIDADGRRRFAERRRRDRGSPTTPTRSSAAWSAASASGCSSSVSSGWPASSSATSADALASAGGRAAAPSAAADAAESAPRPPASVFTAPGEAGRLGSQDDFLKGIAVGAGLVVLGVVAGRLFGRRR